MYTPRSRRILRFVKRLQFYLEVESDDALGAEAAREGISKAEIIRRLVTNHLGRSVDVDPINDLVGRFDGEPGRATTWCTGHEVRRHLVWVALFFHRAANHATATTLWSGQPGAFVATNHELGETWTFIRRRRGPADATRMLDAVNGSRRVTVLRVPQVG